MYSTNIHDSRAASAPGIAALFAVLPMGLALAASPAEAAPFAYVTNSGSNSVSVIDTPTNMVVATVQVGDFLGPVAVTPDGQHVYVVYIPNFVDFNTPGAASVIDTASNTVVATVPVGIVPSAVAVTPDGKHAYVTNAFPTNKVSVIDTATNAVVASFGVGVDPDGVAFSPDGKRAYVTNSYSNNVSVIDTTTNPPSVAATVGAGLSPNAIAVTPDGKHLYVTNNIFPSTVSVIDTATNKVVATVAVGDRPEGVAVTPDGKHAYVANTSAGIVSVIATATNMVVATVPVGNSPTAVAVTPDGKHAYITNLFSNNVSVIDTDTNMVTAIVPVGNKPVGVGIVPPPPGVPFLAFSAKLAIDLDRKPNKDRFELHSSFTLGSTAPAIDPVTQPVTLQIGTFSTTIPPGSFKNHGDEGRFFRFHGVIDGVKLKVLIKRTGTLRYAFDAEAKSANLTGTVNTVYVTLIVGGDSGATSVKARISH